MDTLLRVLIGLTYVVAPLAVVSAVWVAVGLWRARRDPAEPPA